MQSLAVFMGNCREKRHALYTIVYIKMPGN
jgi:hypothetical protein